MKKDNLPDYLNVDEFFRSAPTCTLSRDVREEIRREYDQPIPFSQTEAGQQTSQWSGLLDKVL